MVDPQEVLSVAYSKLESFMLSIKETTRSHCETRIQSLVSAFNKRQADKIDFLLQSSKGLAPENFFYISLSSEGVLTMETRVFCPMTVRVTVYIPDDESEERTMWEGYFQGKKLSVNLSDQLREQQEEGGFSLVLRNKGVRISNVLSLM